MNIKIFTKTFLLCIFTLIASELSTFKMLTISQAYLRTEQESLLQYMQKIINYIFFDHKKKNTMPEKNKEKDPTIISSDVDIDNKNKTPFPSTEKSFDSLTRNDALHIIRLTTEKIFDINDPYHISIHLDDLKRLTTYLDEVVDQKTITAIHFLIENQHRSSYLDFPFWTIKIRELGLDKYIPVTEKVANMPSGEKLKILRTKLSAKKEEIIIPA